MGWEWVPETPEEKAEHQRMRREFFECYGDDGMERGGNSTKKRTSAGIVFASAMVVLLVIIVAWLVGDGYFSGTRPVSPRTAEYLAQTSVINRKLFALTEPLSEDFSDDGSVEYEDYENAVDDLLIEIECLQSKSISRFDDFCPYQDACDEYYGPIYSFFSAAKLKKEIAFSAYQRLALEIDGEALWKCLVELFEDNGYYYYVDKDTQQVHYNVKSTSKAFKLYD